METNMLGIDIGATGIKGALVNVETGQLSEDKIKYRTPKPAIPEEVAKVLQMLVKDFNWKGKKVGIGFPAIIKSGIAHSASNISKSWLNLDVEAFFGKILGAEVLVINDADAAGIAEMHFGKGKGKSGTVLMLTLGTGIGSGLFVDGVLVPNTELGHLHYKESIAEHYASNSARVRKGLNWEHWGQELNAILNYINVIISPDTIILGGGVSKKFSEYRQFLDVPTELIPAQLLNNAGIIGAACLAAEQL